MRPRGDEVISPYFVRADGSQPVTLVPIARYTGANTSQRRHRSHAGELGPRQSAVPLPARRVRRPEPRTTAPTTRSTARTRRRSRRSRPARFSFTRRRPFGLYGSICQLQRRPVQRRRRRARRSTTSACTRPKGEGGVVLPNTWIIAVDVNTNPPDKNFDHQDQVMLLTNARPALSPGTVRGASCRSTAPSVARVPDKDGEGTGFTSIQPNNNGTPVASRPCSTSPAAGSASPPRPDRAAAPRTCRSTRSRPASTAAAPTRTMQARVLGPLTDLTSGFQQKAVFWGPDQDNYLKIEAEHRHQPRRACTSPCSASRAARPPPSARCASPTRRRCPRST